MEADNIVERVRPGLPWETGDEVITGDPAIQVALPVSAENMVLMILAAVPQNIH